MVSILAVLLAGCSTIEYKYKYIEVKVPVAADVTPPPKFTKVKLPIEDLTNKDKKNYPKIAKDYAVSIKILKKELDKRDKALDAYRPAKADK